MNVVVIVLLPLPLPLVVVVAVLMLVVVVVILVVVVVVVVVVILWSTPRPPTTYLQTNNNRHFTKTTPNGTGWQSLRLKNTFLFGLLLVQQSFIVLLFG